MLKGRLTFQKKGWVKKDVAEIKVSCMKSKGELNKWGHGSQTSCKATRVSGLNTVRCLEPIDFFHVLQMLQLRDVLLFIHPQPPDS